MKNISWFDSSRRNDLNENNIDDDKTGILFMPDPRRGYPHRSSIPISIYAKLFAEAIVFSIDEIVGERQRKERILDRQCGVTFDNKKIDRLCR